MKKRVLTVFTALACLASATCSVYAAEEKKETRTVVDHAGNEVECRMRLTALRLSD